MACRLISAWAHKHGSMGVTCKDGVGSLSGGLHYRAESKISQPLTLDERAICFKRKVLKDPASPAVHALQDCETMAGAMKEFSFNSEEEQASVEAVSQGICMCKGKERGLCGAHVAVVYTGMEWQAKSPTSSLLGAQIPHFIPSLWTNYLPTCPTDLEWRHHLPERRRQGPAPCGPHAGHAEGACCACFACCAGRTVLVLKGNTWTIFEVRIVWESLFMWVCLCCMPAKVCSSQSIASMG